MSADGEQQQELLEEFKNFKANIEAHIVRKYQQEIDGLRDELAAARAEIQRFRSGLQTIIAQSRHSAVENIPMTRESDDQSSGSDQDMSCGVAPSVERDQSRDRDPAAPAPSEETLRRYATTVALSTHGLDEKFWE